MAPDNSQNPQGITSSKIPRRNNWRVEKLPLALSFMVSWLHRLEARGRISQSLEHVLDQKGSSHGQKDERQGLEHVPWSRASPK